MSFNPRLKAGDRRYPAAANSANALAANAVVATGPGWLYDIAGYNNAEPYLHIHDAASQPANGTVPLLIIPITAATPQWFEKQFPGGLRFYTGLVICNSSTEETTTIGGATTQFVCNYSLKP